MEPVSYSPSPEDPPEPDPLCQVTPGTGMFLEVSHRMSAQVGGVCPRRPCELPRAVPREVPSRGCPTAHLAPSLPADTVMPWAREQMPRVAVTILRQMPTRCRRWFVPRNCFGSESAEIRMQVIDDVLMVSVMLTMCQKWFLTFSVD